MTPDWLAPVAASLATIGASAFVFWRVHVSTEFGDRRPFWPRLRRRMGTPLPRALARAAIPEPAVPPGAQHLNPGRVLAVGSAEHRHLTWCLRCGRGEACAIADAYARGESIFGARQRRW